MKLSIDSNNKSNLIEKIKEFFSSKFIEETSRLTQFVQRASKLQGLNFFSMCI